MRIPLEKYLIIGPTYHRSPFFRQAQRLGILEFIRGNEKSFETPPEVQLYLDALRILRTRATVKQLLPQMDARSAIVIARHVVDRYNELERLGEKKRICEKEIARIQVFGNFSVPELREIEQSSQRTIQFFFGKSGKHPEYLQNPELIRVGSASELDYFMAINREPVHYEGLIEIRIEKSLGELLEEQAHIQRSIDEVESELALLAHQRKLINQGLVDALNQHHLRDAKELAQDALEGKIFSVEAWVPKNKVALLHKLVEECQMYCVPIRIEQADRVPTYLENKGGGRLGEDLVSIYDTPSNRDRDPSWWVYIAFGLFFSMIVADAGYGLLLLAISLFFLRKFRKKQGAVKRLLILSTSLSCGCIVWGIFTASFLGINLPLDSPLRKISLIDGMVKKKVEYMVAHKTLGYEEMVQQYPAVIGMTDPDQILIAATKKDGHKVTYQLHEDLAGNVFMELVLFIGCIHITLSLLRYVDRNWSAIGWVIFIVGGYLYFPSVLKATSLIHYLLGVPEVAGATVGLYLLFIGMGMAWVLAIIQKKLGGLADIMNVIQLFADVMSYLRIYALALAGMVMASTFNSISASLPFYLGVLVLIGGHTVNFVLALMGGIIHGLRLNFIEWYHYSFEGGGKPFRPLSLLKIE